MSDRGGWIQVEWLDGKVESHYGQARILDSQSHAGVLVIYERTSSYGPEETIKISAPLAGLRKWTPAEHA